MTTATYPQIFWVALHLSPTDLIRIAARYFPKRSLLDYNLTGAHNGALINWLFSLSYRLLEFDISHGASELVGLGLVFLSFTIDFYFYLMI